MAGGVFSLANLFGITLRESANDGSDFTNPDADYRRVFLGEDGELHKKDSAGAVTGFAGSGIAATILDAKGDIIAASAADTPAKVTVGANGTVLEAASGASAGVQWDYPPGYEWDYAQITTAATITATSEGASATVVSGASVTYDGAPVIVEFNCPFAQGNFTTFCIVLLYDGSTVLGRLGRFDVVGGDGAPMRASVRITPSAAAHQYIVKAYIDAGTNAVFQAAGGGSATYYPTYIRVIKA